MLYVYLVDLVGIDTDDMLHVGLDRIQDSSVKGYDSRINGGAEIFVSFNKEIVKQVMHIGGKADGDIGRGG